MTPFQAYLPEYNCIHVANFSPNSHTFPPTKSRLFLVDPSFTARSATDGSRPDGNDFSWNTIFGNANTRVRVGIRVFQIEKEKRKRGPLSNRHAVVKDTGVTTRASVQLENFFFDLPSPSLQLFYARCFHPRAIYGPSERHSLRPSPVL